MTDPIRAALDRLEEYDAADPYHDCRDILAAARRAISNSDGPTPVTERDVREWINSQSLWPPTRDELVSIVMQALARWGTANSAQVSSSLAVVKAIREEILHIDPNDLNNGQVNLVLSIIDNHLP